ncbi:hypothetical protein [Nocardia huaxiensis]|uniref:hypothetical protein n=1 Tax=Nocardia huaxiensis TaxID=2755382 RepID=UPI001E2B4930|nr:hypothetical protein [Nocardia huaxiensis]UFS94541.1 hypothetical protein LPY97_27860 [Nocardia huaxiensis]
MSDDAAQDKKNDDEATTGTPAAADADQPGGTADADQTEKAAAAAKPELTKKSGDDQTEKIDKVEPVAVDTAKADAAKADKPAKAAKPAESGDGKTGAAAGSGLPGGKITVPMLAAVVAGVLLVAAIATAAALGWQSHSRGNQLSERDSATEAACDFGRVVSIYDDKSMDNFISQVKERSTGQFLDNFQSTADALKDVMVSVQGKSSLAEIHCAWQSGDENKATVIMLISQVRQNSLMQSPDRLTLPVVAELEKKDGKWLMANFDSPALKGLSTGGGTTTAPQAGQPSTGAPAPTTGAPAPGN